MVKAGGDAGDGAGDDKGAASMEALAAKAAELEAQNTKLQKGYKEIEADRNKVRDNLINTRKVLEEAGLAEWDEQWNVKIKAATKKDQDPVDMLEKEVSKLDKQLDDGEIDPDEYAKKATSIKAKIEVQKEARKILTAQEQREKEKAEKGKIADELNYYLEELRTNYPEFDDVESPLFKEMDRIYQENPRRFADVQQNVETRLTLAEKAAANLEARGVQIKRSREYAARVRNEGMTTLNSGGYQEEDRGGDVDNTIAGKLVKSKFGDKLMKELNTSFKDYNKTGIVRVEM